MKRLALLIVTVAVAGWACAGGAPEGPRKLKFALIPKALDIPVFNYANQGAQRQAAEFGDVEVIYRGPDHGDVLKQLEVLESFISQKVDGIAISVLNSDTDHRQGRRRWNPRRDLGFRRASVKTFRLLRGR
jgi:ribose transport system substrate-binding protein